MVRRSSRVLVAGLALVILGLGNWAMAGRKVEQYEVSMARARQAGGPAVERPFRGTASILEERGQAHERYESARLKREYYLVVYRGGVLLSVLGLSMCMGALLRRRLVPEAPDYSVSAGE